MWEETGTEMDSGLGELWVSCAPPQLKQPSTLRLLHHGHGIAGLCAYPDQLPLLLVLQPQPVPGPQSLQEHAGSEGHPGPSEAQVITTKGSLSWHGNTQGKGHRDLDFQGVHCDLFQGGWWVGTVTPCMLGMSLLRVLARIIALFSRGGRGHD